MDWRAGLRNLAVKLDIDPEAAVAKAEELANGARTLANDLAEQAAPIAKDVGARLQNAATSLANEVGDRLEKRARQTPAAPPAESGTGDSIVETVRVARSSVAAKAAKVVAGAAAGAKAHVVKANAGGAFDLTGLSITAEDAKELARIPEGMQQAVLERASGDAQISAELAEGLRAYIAATPQTIFDADSRIRKDASALAKRTGLRQGQLQGIWGGVNEAAALLQRHDAAHDTDFATSSWLGMLGAWSFPQIKDDHGELMRAIRTGIQLAAKSRRASSHAEQLCNLVLAAAHDPGYPTSLFHEASVLQDFIAVAVSAADDPAARDKVAERLLTLVRGIMASPVRDSELGRLGMNPHVFRAEFGKAGAEALEALGRAEAQGMRSAAEGLYRAEAQASSEELREIERYPRWLAEPATRKDPQAFATDTMSDAQALELLEFVRGARGDLGQLSWRLETLWRTPSTCEALAERFGVEAEPPRNDEPTSNLLSEASKVVANTSNAMRMLIAFDGKHGTHHAIDAGRALLDTIKHGEGTRDLVNVVGSAFASEAATAQDKRHFIKQIPRLIEAGAWPGIHGRDAVVATAGLLKGVTDLAKDDAAIAGEVFIGMFKVTSTPVVTELDSTERRTDDIVGRAAVAELTAQLAQTLGRETDAAHFAQVEQKLRSQLKEV